MDDSTSLFPKLRVTFFNCHYVLKEIKMKVGEEKDTIYLLSIAKLLLVGGRAVGDLGS